MGSVTPVSSPEITLKTLSTLGVTPCKFQTQVCDLQLQGRHCFLISPTGSGKSLSFLMPFIWQRTGVCILISPLQLLGNQHATHPWIEKLGIRAINLTAETTSDSLFKDIAAGKYHLVVASPEYVEQDSRFRKYLWDSASFRKQVTRIVFDEAHCVMDWGGFRPAYRRLRFLRPLLPDATFLALSATLTPTMVAELKSLLGLYDVKVIRRSNDRLNVAPVVKPMKYTLQSLHDLAFLIPLGVDLTVCRPPKFMLFVQSKKMCQRAGHFLRARLPPDDQDRVLWVHSEMTSGFNQRTMEKLRNSEIYGVVCTDVAGMGIDIPDVVLSVQYQVPDKHCTHYQRSGRSGRDQQRWAYSILLAEKKYLDKTKQMQWEQARKAQETKQKKKRKAEATLESPKPSQSPRVNLPTGLAQASDVTVKLEEDVESKPVPVILAPVTPKQSQKRLDIEPVMDQYINAHSRGGASATGDAQPSCRRSAGNSFFGNPSVPKVGDDNYCCTRCCPPTPPPDRCCDMCNPLLADTLTGCVLKEPPPSTNRAPAQSKIPANKASDWTDADVGLKEALCFWRDQAAEARWGPNHLVGGLGILSNQQVKRIIELARLQIVPTLSDFTKELKWLYMPVYGAEVLSIVHSSHPPRKPQPPTIPHNPISIITQADGVPGNVLVKTPKPPVCTSCFQAGHIRKLKPLVPK